MYTTNWYEVETDMPVREKDRLRAAHLQRTARAARRAGVWPAVDRNPGILAAGLERVGAGTRKAVRAIGSRLARSQRPGEQCC